MAGKIPFRDSHAGPCGWCQVPFTKCPTQSNRRLDTSLWAQRETRSNRHTGYNSMASSLGMGRQNRNGGPTFGHVSDVGIRVDPERLRLELARRGWTASRLATKAGVSSPTVSAALAGRAIAAQSLGLIARALSSTPPIREIDHLIGVPDGGSGLS